MLKILAFFVFILFISCNTPKAFFVIEQNKGFPVNFSVKSQSSNAEDIFLDCGNGIIKDGNHLNCEYLSSGRYTISLTAVKGKKKSVYSKEIIVPSPEECLLVMETTKGDVTIRLYEDTPLHRENFILLAEKGFYEGLLFHRVISGFMIQGGDPETKNAAKDTKLGGGNPGYTIPAEINKKYFHTKGALAAARTGDDTNPKKESSGSQFYIVHGRKITSEDVQIFEGQKNLYYPEEVVTKYVTEGGAPQLDAEYTIFGEVVDGIEVIDAISSVPTDSYDRPKEDVKILKLTVIK